MRYCINQVDYIDLEINLLYILHSKCISLSLNIQIYKKSSNELNSDTINWFYDRRHFPRLSPKLNESRNAYLLGDEVVFDFKESIKKRLNICF